MNMNLMQKKSIEVSSLLKNFSHPQRLLILCYLSEGERQVSDIQQAIGLSQSQTSQFLKRMQNEGLLGLRKEKNYCFYFICKQEILMLLKAIQKIFCH